MMFRFGIACVGSAMSLLSMAPVWAGIEGPVGTSYGTQAGANNSSDSNENTFIGAYAGNHNTTGSRNTFIGRSAGAFSTTGTDNTFVGLGAGESNGVGAENTFVGQFAGASSADASYNTFVGRYAGLSNSAGQANTFLGRMAGHDNATGSHNVFLGNGAGYSETGSNKLYIDSCSTGGFCTSPFIYGEFENHLLKINGVVNVRANGVARSQLHFSVADTDTGGWLTSALDNNFFVSSGARYDATAGNWIQRSPDNQAVIAGSGGVGYRIFTSSGNSVGANFTPTVRLHIDYAGNLGLNTPALAGTPIQHSSGAHLTAGGVWTDASSRSYKEHIAELSTADAITTLAALTPVTYNYKVDGDEKYVGFIAEDVPELVARKDHKSLSPMDIVAVLTKVVQEKSRLLDEQEKSIRELRAAVSALQAERGGKIAPALPR